MSDGTVRYAGVDFDASWAPEDKLVVIPFKAMKTGPDTDLFTLHLDPKAVGRAPAFDKEAWPNLNEHYCAEA